MIGREKILPKDWKTQKFADVIAFLTDYQANGSFAGLKENVQYYSEKNYAVLVRLKDLRHEMRDENSFVYTDEKGYNFLKKSRVIEGDILVANVGAGVGTTLQMSKFKGKATLGPNMFRVDLKDSISKKFFLAFSNSIGYWHQLKLVSAGSGQPKINKAQYKSIEIPLPPKPTQQAIVSKIEELFSELDKGIENLRLAQQQLKTYRQAVLKWAFEGKLTNEDLKEVELPKGWKWVTMNDVCIKIGDIDHKMPKQLSSGYPYVSTKDFTDDLKISFDKAKYISKEDYLNLSRKIKPERGDIIFPRYGTIGKNILVDFDKEFLVSYSCAVIKPNHDLVLSKYLYLYSLSPKVTDEIRKYVVETTQANIGIASIKRFVFPLPTIDEQNNVVQEIESRLSVADKTEESITQSLQQAEALRQSILKKAFEGRLV